MPLIPQIAPARCVLLKILMAGVESYH